MGVRVPIIAFGLLASMPGLRASTAFVEGNFAGGASFTFAGGIGTSFSGTIPVSLVASQSNSFFCVNCQLSFTSGGLSSFSTAGLDAWVFSAGGTFTLSTLPGGFLDVDNSGTLTPGDLTGTL
jgi:hypothetical protein